MASDIRGRPSARRVAAGFLRRMVSSDDVSRKVNKAPVLARARSVHSSDPKENRSDGTAKGKSGRRARALSSPRNSLSVDELLECAICLERMRRPKMLPCQHTFCLSCLEVQQMSVTNKNPAMAREAHIKLICPTCRLEVKLPRETGLTALPSNLYIESLLRVVKNTGGRPSSSQQPARQQPAARQRLLRCSLCDTACENRRCDHCQQILCDVCWPGHLSDLQGQLSSVRLQLTNARERLNHKQEDFKSRCERLLERVAMAVENKVRTLHETGAELTNEARRIQNEHDISANELQARLVRELAAPTEEEQFELADDSNKVVIFMKTHRAASELLNAVSRWGESRPTLDEDNLKIERASMDFTDLSGETEDYVDHPNDNRSLDPDNQTQDSLILFYKSRSAVPRLRLGRGSVQRPAGLGVAPWAAGTELYVTATDGHVVLVFDKRTGRLLRQLVSSEPPNHMLCPSGVAFSAPRAEVYITDKWRHCVHVFSSDGRYLRRLGSKGSVEGAFLAPEGVACDPGADVLYVCDTCNDRVQVIRIDNGAYINQLGTLASAGRAEFNQPTSVALGADKIVICDHGNRRIKVYSRKSGLRVLEFGSLGSATGQFRSPECVAVDKMGFIFVGDSGNGRVQIFRPGGQLIRAFGRFSWVSGIHVTPSYELLVSDSKGHCVNIYK